MIIASAKAVSAAATAIIKIEKIAPPNSWGNKYLLKITKFNAAEFKINSIDINIAIRFLRVTKP
jgi:hypothetical protein